ncbi:MAG: hypothetical protein KAU20_03395 [Nanoarchaeota archaeon]|nr:hypothetical protein [Nanoarchaeota archaeon]
MQKIINYKKTCILILFLLLLFIFSLNTYAITNLSITSKKISRPFLDGQSLEYKWVIKNVGLNNISSFSLIFEIENCKTKEALINLTCVINSLKVNKTTSCKSPKIHVVDAGIHRLFIYPKNKESIIINGRSLNQRNWIDDNFRVYTPTELFAIIGVIITFLILWNQFLKGGNITLSHPKYYSLINDHKNKILKFKLPLIFQNDGAKSSSVSYLMVVLKNGRERIVLKWNNLSNGNKVSQFIVRPRDHIEKIITFVSEYNKVFDLGKWNIEIISYKDGYDIRMHLLSFDSNLKITKRNIDFDFWQDIYNDEKKMSMFSKIIFWGQDRFPKGYVKLIAGIFHGFQRFFGKR